MSLQKEIAAEAKRLGFILFGVTVPGTPPHFNVYESCKAGMARWDTWRQRGQSREGLILV